ncbi:bifunctional 4-hydroxy-2-oxoglutarate aldolase/2-dehydro-3-deoxy-phosphogluconate aldolase [Microbacterium sulfonylureivorans]|uniref:bifunctional 4-hydroxy-2-oxoglutarate aldolase/2-dehydro-3-deoxy-phosphogluconate aldolase n=1 Tax=Microbacterium sulfonylureivorans TaxID=2486854 RepID=UPI000FDC1451|nr:bifunctional 4-hydroxy-2-oxoglutarate aldolase/2-dehydro-3-deoxy-phosphogluconate aldolase [Microbacterium sulfonylureivorans]
MAPHAFGEDREIVPTFGAIELHVARQTAEALAAGGIRYIEVLLRHPDAWRVLEAVGQIPGISVGAGTVLDGQTARRARDAGAAFLVSPGFDAELAREISQLGIPYVPGVATASDLMLASKAGYREVKFFPAEQLGGPRALAALAAAFPSTRFMPTGGVNADRLGDYALLEQVFAVGGSWLTDAGTPALDAVTTRAQRALSILQGRQRS